MEWLDELQVALAFFFWGSMAWAYLKVRAFRNSFEQTEPGYRLLGIIVTLFGAIVALTATSLPRMVLNLNAEADVLRVVFSVAGTLVYGAVIWWTILAVRELARQATPSEYDPYEKPFGDQ